MHVEVQVFQTYEHEWEYEDWLVMMESQSGDEDVTAPKNKHVYAM